MPVEMEQDKRNNLDLGRGSPYKKSPGTTPKSYSVKSTTRNHEQPYRSSASAIEDLFWRKKDKTSPGLKSKDVLNRLDSLVAGNAQEMALEYKSILKQKSDLANTRRKKRHIRFPDSKKLHEIIGWDGGEENYGVSSTSGDSSDEDEKKPIISKSFKNEELTIEERNVINLTRKNTSYNAHAPNLLKDNPKPSFELNPGTLALGNEKSKSPPMVMVRPFTSNSSPGKVNKVKPMINGEIVKTRDMERRSKSEQVKLSNTFDKVTNKHRKEPITDKLNSDGGSSESSSPPVSDVESSASLSPEQDKARSPLLSSNTAIKIDIPSSYRQSQHNIDTVDTGKPKVDNVHSSTMNRLSFLNSTLSTERTHTEAISPNQDYTIRKGNCVTVVPKSTSSLAHSPSKLSENLSTIAKSDEYTSVYVSSANSLKGSKEAESLVDEKRRSGTQLNRSKTSSVKLTRSSPYTLGTSLSTSILKGTPKPSVVVRKPPVSKDKPKLPQKPTNIISSKFNSANITKNNQSRSEISNTTKVQTKTSVNVEGKSRVDSSDVSSPTEMPRLSKTTCEAKLDFSEVTISEQSEVEIITVNGKSTSIMAECYSADSDVQNALIIDVKASKIDSENENTNSLKLTINTKDTNVMHKEQELLNSQKIASDTSTSPEKNIPSSLLHSVGDKNSNVVSKNREELLKAIRESLSDKLLPSNSTSIETKESATSLSNQEIASKESTAYKDVIDTNNHNDATKNKRDISEGKTGLEKSCDTNNANSSFQATRATIASALGGKVSHNEKPSMRQSFAKRKAPKPPSPKLENNQDESIEVFSHSEQELSNVDASKIAISTNESNTLLKGDEHNDSIELNTEESSCILTAPTKDLPPEPIVNTGFRERAFNPKKPLSPPPPISFKQSHPPPTKSVLAAAARHSSMKSEMSPNRNAIKKGVQFNPETTMVKLPDSMDLHVTNHQNPIKTIRWLKDGSSPTNIVPKVVESSFTGQPIQVSNTHHAPTSSTAGISPARLTHRTSSQPSHLQQGSHHKADKNTHLLSPVVSYAQNVPSKVSVYSVSLIRY